MTEFTISITRHMSVNLGVGVLIIQEDLTMCYVVVGIIGQRVVLLSMSLVSDSSSKITIITVPRDRALIEGDRVLFPDVNRDMERVI